MKIWKRVHGELVGFGNGYRAHLYGTQGFPELNIDPIWTVLIHKGDKRVAKEIKSSEAAAKRWAETNYLRGK